MAERRTDMRIEDCGWLARLLYRALMPLVLMVARPLLWLRVKRCERQLKRHERCVDAAVNTLRGVLGSTGALEIYFAIEKHCRVNGLDHKGMLYIFAADRACDGATVETIKLELAAEADRLWAAQGGGTPMPERSTEGVKS